MGYQDKQKVLVEKIFRKMATFKVDPKRFEILKEAVSVLNFLASYMQYYCRFIICILWFTFRHYESYATTLIKI